MALVINKSAVVLIDFILLWLTAQLKVSPYDQRKMMPEENTALQILDLTTELMSPLTLFH